MTTIKRLAAAYDDRLARMSASEKYRQYLANLQAEWDRRTK